MTRADLEPAAPHAAHGGAPDDFDRSSGSLVERMIFNHRLTVVVLCIVLSVVLGAFAAQLRPNASFEKTIPTGHPYIANYLRHQADLRGLDNAVRVIVENPKGTIYDGAYMDRLRRLNDDLFLMPGVSRERMKSLWTPSTRWSGVTEEGLEGGPVIPDGFDGSPASLRALQANIARSGEIGQLVALDARSSVIVVPLASRHADGTPLDYGRFARQVEQLRQQYDGPDLRIRVTGFAQRVGDLIDGLRAVAWFFVGTLLIAAVAVYAYTRCVRSTALVMITSLIAVVWQLGLLRLLGYDLDPYSVLVPFLVFAIGMSHGAQKMNGIRQDVERGIDKLLAARFTFRRLFLAGLTALVADAVGFAVLLVIDIQAIRELAIAASLGVAVLIFTNLILLPVALSYTGVSPRPVGRGDRALWAWLAGFTGRRRATVAVAVAAVLAVTGAAVSTQLKIGDLDAGAPELRPDARYNQDVAYQNARYGTGSDVFAILVRTPPGECVRHDTLARVDALEWELQQLPGVESTNSLALLNRRVLVGLSEGNPKWYDLIQNQEMLNTATGGSPRGLYNDSCDLLTLYAFLVDHKADTLDRVVSHVERFAQAHNTPQREFALAAGSAGIEAATNIVVRQAWWQMLGLVYAAVIVLCFITFRSWRAVVVAVLPLALTSVLAEALMVALGIGVKVATLPVVALGVGIGVDYSLYILSVTLARLRTGESLQAAYRGSLLFTGRVVMLTGVTLAAGVATWVLSPIKFQADMGVLLAFMFLVNMLGALVLLPALAHFLLKPAKASTAPHATPSTAVQTAEQRLPGPLLKEAL
jgi:hypothetical protein